MFELPPGYSGRKGKLPYLSSILHFWITDCTEATRSVELCRKVYLFEGSSSILSHVTVASSPCASVWSSLRVKFLASSVPSCGAETSGVRTSTTLRAILGPSEALRRLVAIVSLNLLC